MAKLFSRLGTLIVNLKLRMISFKIAGWVEAFKSSKINLWVVKLLNYAISPPNQPVLSTWASNYSQVFK